MSLRPLLLLLPLALACRAGDKSAEGGAAGGDTGVVDADSDGDGFPASEDCDDTDASVNAGAVEVCDGVDNDCDGEVDEGVTGTWYEDADGDGYGDASAPIEACDEPAGAVTNDSDCDDDDDRVYPSARELCDGVDNDCNGVVDDGGVYPWYADADGDGHGDPDTKIEDCAEPEGYVEEGDDCDDADPAVSPSADEVCNEIDDDCDGDIDEPDAADATTWYLDRDSDGFGDDDTARSACEAPSDYVDQGGDCDDDDDEIHPDAAEICNAVDDDCDGLVDDDDPDVDTSLGGTFYTDDDGDGFGDADVPVVACAQPSGTVLDDRDCDDTNAAINPPADEVCDGLDNDCDGLTDDDDRDLDSSTASSWYTDDDGDGYAGAGTTLACVQPVGTDTSVTDCDDTDAAIHPAASEVCDGADNDCDGLIDDDDSSVDTATGSTWYRDADSDGYGGSRSVEACTQPTGTVTTSTDCDDRDSAVHPGATEVCNSADDDCDGLVDDDDGSLDSSTGSTFYADADSDGYGGASSVQACAQPAGTTTSSSDCDDSSAAVNPGASEVCNGIDDDCDGLTDDDDSSLDSSTGSTWYLDSDSDGYGGSRTVQACTQQTGTVASSTDCDDRDSAINPGASEVCNSVDDDCDGLVDDADGSLDASSGSTFYTDADSDGYGGTSSVQACVQPSGTVTSSNDCNDSSAAVNPGASEVCNSVDDDCDGLVDDDDSSLDASTGSTYYRDRDADAYGDASSTTQACSLPSGYALNGSDCNDSDGAVNPGEDELCNSVDDDCDGLIDDDDSDLDLSSASTWYPDDDEDGYGDPTGTAVSACDEPSGYVDDDTDCDDADVDVNPGGTEACNGYDDDCDGTADSSSVCPCDVEYYTSTEAPYLFCTTTETWTSARSECRTYGYDLATINTSAENTWINSTADSYSTAKWWMGFNDRTTEGTWVWASGQSVTFTDWEPGEPNDSGFREDCGQLNRFSGDTWNDEPCFYTFRYICEAN